MQRSQLREKGLRGLKREKSLLLSLSLFLFFICSLAPLRAQNDDLLNGLSLEQRVAQLFMVNLYGAGLTEAGRDFLMRYQPGGVVLLGENISTPDAVTRLTNSYQQTIKDAGGIPLLVSVDQEGGPISHLQDGFTTFPTSELLTAAGDADLAHATGAAIADELSAVGVNMDLAPIADLETNPNNPIIVRRSFGSDPVLVSPMVAAFIEGMQGAGVISTAKHFPGHGESSTDSHTGLPVINLTRERLEQVELAPFRAAIDSGVGAIMVAHIWYPALESQPDLPASLSANVVTGLLRDELGYDGIIMTDALDMDAIDTTYNYSDAVLQAVEAGVDLVIAAHISLDAQQQAIQALIDAVHAGTISEERINESARRILTAKAQYNLLDWQPLDPSTASQRVDLDSHAELVTQIFNQGVTLAYDQNQLIPIADDRSLAIVYLGSRYQIVQECSTYRSNIAWVGVSDIPTDNEISSAKTAATLADTVVVFTQNADSNGAQAALVNALPPDKTVAVALWSVYDWLAYPHVAAYIATYSPLRPAVPAACALLFGALPATAQIAIAMPGIP